MRKSVGGREEKEMSRLKGNRIGMHKNEIETPVLMVDLDVMERNLKKMADFFKGVKAKLRPHTKSHKTPALAHKQIEAGAIGICCGSLDEAQVMISAGIRDVLVTREIVLPGEITRVIGLARHSELMIPVDNEEGAERISRAAEAKGVKIRTLVDVMTRLGRCGVPPGQPALSLARRVNQMKGLRLMGLMGYEGSMHGWEASKREATCREELAILMDTKERVERDGMEVDIVSAGASSTYRVAGTYPGVTEVQAGSYLMMDGEYRSWFSEFEIALSVLTTVINRPSPMGVATDAGKKKLTEDAGLPQPKEPGGMKVVALHEEHGILEPLDPHQKVKIGDKIEIIPSHGCTTFNLYDQVYGMRDDYLEVIWDVAARGT